MAEATPDANAGEAEQTGREDYGILIGWKHHVLSRGIDLTVQTTERGNLAPGATDARHLLMTNNQALLLAKYLLDVTGQTLPQKPKRGLFARLFS